jgi:glutamate/tyrosine decarboxylase-like PLP-dependent enzyme
MNDAAHPFDRHIAERFFTTPAPIGEFPPHSEDPFTARALLQSEVVLDGDPSKNLATFVTTWMEPFARDVIAENLHRNYIDHAEYPRTAEIAARCVRMMHNLLHGEGEPEAPGTACAGSSEAVMLGALAMKWRWKARRERAGKPTDRPNLVYGANVHVVWDKFWAARPSSSPSTTTSSAMGGRATNRSSARWTRTRAASPPSSPDTMPSSCSRARRAYRL